MNPSPVALAWKVVCVCVCAYDGLHSAFVHFFVHSAQANPASFITAGLLVAVAFPLLFDKQLPGGKWQEQNGFFCQSVGHKEPCGWNL